MFVRLFILCLYSYKDTLGMGGTWSRWSHAGVGRALGRTGEVLRVDDGLICASLSGWWLRGAFAGSWRPCCRRRRPVPVCWKSRLRRRSADAGRLHLCVPSSSGLGTSGAAGRPFGRPRSELRRLARVTCASGSSHRPRRLWLRLSSSVHRLVGQA